MTSFWVDHRWSSIQCLEAILKFKCLNKFLDDFDNILKWLLWVNSLWIGSVNPRSAPAHAYSCRSCIEGISGMRPESLLYARFLWKSERGNVVHISAQLPLALVIANLIKGWNLKISKDRAQKTKRNRFHPIFPSFLSSTGSSSSKCGRVKCKGEALSGPILISNFIILQSLLRAGAKQTFDKCLCVLSDSSSC